ncbi:MAG TPA: SPOR domain-containing protein, partial [Longimicrobium sp.]|nr:SPOR domain-containing protein [Longimicrobium sp.]
GAARRALEQVRREEPNVPFFIVPEEDSGIMYYTVYAGMLGDTTEAAALRARLLSRKLVNPDDVGGPAALIQERAWAFDLGDYATREAAETRADSLAARNVPAYAVPVPQSDGSERWKLYGGAFADSTDAGSMKRLLESAGLPARLVPRTGRPPATSK